MDLSLVSVFERFWPAYCQPADYQTSSQPPQNLPPLRVHLRLHNNHFTLLLPEVGSPLDQLIQDLADAYDDLSAYPSVIDHYAQLPIDSFSETDWSVSNTIIQLLQNEPGDATSPSASQQGSSAADSSSTVSAANALIASVPADPLSRDPAAELLMAGNTPSCAPSPPSRPSSSSLTIQSFSMPAHSSLDQAPHISPLSIRNHTTSLTIAQLPCEDSLPCGPLSVTGAACAIASTACINAHALSLLPHRIPRHELTVLHFTY